MSSTATTTMLQNGESTSTSTQPSPLITVDKASNSVAPSRPGLPRRSSSLHKLLITKLRPLPFQYRWSVWHSKSSDTTTSSQLLFPLQAQSLDAYQLSVLAESVADIGAFYRIFNNLPWSGIRQKDSVHIFRAGVKPLWEDEENKRGGRWLLRVRPEFEGTVDVNVRRDVRTWEEICLLCLGGELQSILAQGTHLFRPLFAMTRG